MANPCPTEDLTHTVAKTETAGISLTMRIPPFWRDRPRLWFISFEAATNDMKKGQAQLAQMVIAQLERQDIEQIMDLLYNPPETNQYDAIKERLISAYEESDSRQFQKLLSEMELGDQKPTQLLRRMRNLARDKVPDSTLRLMWTNHLPSHIRSVLAVSESFSTKTELEELALLADKMMEQSASTTEVSAIQPSPAQSTSSSHTDTQYLINEIRKLSLEIAELKSRPAYNPDYRRRRYPSQQRTRSTSRSRNRDSSSPSPFCYYHRRFKEQARRCTPPCSFKATTSEN
ncbi:uncharacterized protein LOC111357982 [Spodoptera litura]|uniref:Uncharacterized protein LOC111352900 n=1 Tax=Spodoptera litura TaxID=69820 RepID=A0A9J7EE10_SPOLT|nr:uncharacterized protein LOC111352900 [Spodoptera litura]XP_022826594.1 uncharacterized protein LOC111356462 [Spodoptera litura]XP_022828601.1 uncharacterized protein LOC111357982 [Spodoptera litura]